MRVRTAARNAAIRSPSWATSNQSKKASSSSGNCGSSTRCSVTVAMAWRVFGSSPASDGGAASGAATSASGAGACSSSASCRWPASAEATRSSAGPWSSPSSWSFAGSWLAKSLRGCSGAGTVMGNARVSPADMPTSDFVRSSSASSRTNARCSHLSSVSPAASTDWSSRTRSPICAGRSTASHSIRCSRRCSTVRSMSASSIAVLGTRTTRVSKGTSSNSGKISKVAVYSRSLPSAMVMMSMVAEPAGDNASACIASSKVFCTNAEPTSASSLLPKRCRTTLSGTLPGRKPGSLRSVAVLRRRASNASDRLPAGTETVTLRSRPLVVSTDCRMRESCPRATSPRCPKGWGG